MKAKNLVVLIYVVIYALTSCVEGDIDKYEAVASDAIASMKEPSTELEALSDGVMLFDTVQNQACIPQPDADSFWCTTDYVHRKLIKVPREGARPPCRVWASYFITVCKHKSKDLWVTYLYDLKVSPDYYGCDLFLTWFLYEVPDYQKGKVWDDLIYDVSQIIELSQAYHIAVQNPFLPRCPDSFLVANYIKRTCYNRCLTFVESNPPRLDVIDEYCGVECCIRTRSACKSAYTEETIYFGEPKFSVEGDTCIPSVFVCPPNSIPVTNCNSYCGPE